ncbi:hypothetical protein CALCODRAFT_106752 [Calocera cornea HHB12733]|uniref:DUF92-domain-containing protein n=1 Tax=Calocera cornea HHB12733 TaxID=1353952 RepID=A0A165IFN9_9BASI|nr:hypothetical protein CALCODRAFT_106752 [Calocera cornea HHB12733]
MSAVSYVLPPVVGLGLCVHGLRRKSLSPPGAVAAFSIGAVSLSSPLRTFGSSLVLFYLLGSRATKVGKARKQALEEGAGVGEGRRGVGQVLVGGGVGVLAAAGWAMLFAGDRWPWAYCAPLVRAAGLEQRAFDLVHWSPLGDRRSRALIMLSLGHFATCLGDTLASELGILARSPPRLITTLRPVPPGTNGGVSLPGTLASLLGGAAMGVIYACGLALESPAAARAWPELAKVVAWGTTAGLVGSMLDSLLGATLQQTVYNARAGRVVTDEAGRRRGEDDKVISGWKVLSNVAVNCVTATAVGLGLAWAA